MSPEKVGPRPLRRCAAQINSLDIGQPDNTSDPGRAPDKQQSAAAAFYSAGSCWLNQIVRRRDLAKLETRICASLFLFADPKAFARDGRLLASPTQAELAQLLSATPQGIQITIRRLMGRGLLRLHQRSVGKARPNIYALVIIKEGELP